MVLFTACQDDDHDCGDTYFWSMGRKSALQTVKDKILVVYKADNEEKLKEELAKNGLSLTNITLDYTLIHLDEVSETDRQLLSDSKKSDNRSRFSENQISPSLCSRLVILLQMVRGRPRAYTKYCYFTKIEKRKGPDEIRKTCREKKCAFYRVRKF